MSKPYTVALHDAPEIPVAERIAAEVRFIKEVERAFGSADEVARVYRAWVDANECDASELDAESAALAVRWPKAAAAAAQSGMRNIGELPGAHFVVRLERGYAGTD